MRLFEPWQSQRRCFVCYAQARRVGSCKWFTHSLTLFVRTIQFYRTTTGKCPVEEFLDSLPDKHTQKVAWVFRLVERIDVVPKQYFKKLVGTEDLREIRVQFGGSSYRFLGFFDDTSFLVPTSGFVKKQQKTPLREIELARERRTGYLQQKE